MNDHIGGHKAEIFRWYFLQYDITALTQAVTEKTVAYSKIKISTEAISEFEAILSGTPKAPTISLRYLDTISAQRLAMPIFAMRLPKMESNNEFGLNLPGQLSIDGNVLRPGSPIESNIIIIDGNHRLLRAHRLKQKYLSGFLFEYDNLNRFFVE